jgi:hypothetical protein
MKVEITLTTFLCMWYSKHKWSVKISTFIATLYLKWQCLQFFIIFKFDNNFPTVTLFPKKSLNASTLERRYYSTFTCFCNDWQNMFTFRSTITGDYNSNDAIVKPGVNPHIVRWRSAISRVCRCIQTFFWKECHCGSLYFLDPTQQGVEKCQKSP